jgi:hypothetical protein
VFSEKIQSKLYTMSNAILKESFEIKVRSDDKVSEFQKTLRVADIATSVTRELV